MSHTDKTHKLIKELEEERNALYVQKEKTLPIYIIVPILFSAFSIFIGHPMAIFILSIFAAITSYGIYYSNYTSPFIKLKNKVKNALVDEYMSIYHPTISHEYRAEGNSAEKIIEKSDLFSAHRYNEEDVITGRKGNTSFYLSEINLQNKRKSDDNTTYHTVFKGFLFKIRLKDRIFPTSHIYTEANMWKRWFSNINENKEYGFWYETNDEDGFHDELQSLFPFIQHLSQRGDLRLSTKGDEITIMMESDIKFLDDPKPSINKSFEDESYYAQMGKQLNSILFIIESFADELSPIEIEKELELRMLEYSDNRRSI